MTTPISSFLSPGLTPQKPASRRRQCKGGLYAMLIVSTALVSTSTGAFLPKSSLLVPRSRSYLLVTPAGETPLSSYLIDLQTFLKLTNIVSTGGDAKTRIQGGECKVNGAVEERRAKKLFAGDRVEVDGVELDVKNEVNARGYMLKLKAPKEQGPGYTAPTKAKEYSGEFRTEEWREERKQKKIARKKDNQDRRVDVNKD